MNDPVLAHLQADRSGFIDRLKQLVEIPSVSTDAAYLEPMAQARALLMDRLRAAGFSAVQELEAGGHPAVYAQWLDAGGAPTFLVYGHYDVQPPDPEDRWHSPAFEPDIRDERLYGRGVSDDKGPFSIALETLFAFLAVEGRLPVNIRILLEGEEEIGSATLPAIFSKHRDLLTADAVISADGARWRADLASINTGSRGSLRCEFSITTAAKDLHSGRYGGAVRNALHDMAELLATLHRPDGQIAVEGFYEQVQPLSEVERERLAGIQFSEVDFLDSIGGHAHGEPGYTTLERLWYRPTLEINGMWGGYTGAGSKTVTPHEAAAKLTMRLAPGQTADHLNRVLEAHLRTHCPAGAKLDLKLEQTGCSAYTVPAEHPLLAAAEQAIETALGRKPVHVRTGSTLPLTDIIKRASGLDTVMLSFSTADEDFHAPNEFFRLSAIDEGCAAWVSLLRTLGGHDRAAYASFRSSS